MRRIELLRGDFEHGLSSISKEFFEKHLGVEITDCVTQGCFVVVYTKDNIAKTPEDLEKILASWQEYYRDNWHRFDFYTHILHDEDTQLIRINHPEYREIFTLDAEALKCLLDIDEPTEDMLNRAFIQDVPKKNILFRDFKKGE